MTLAPKGVVSRIATGSSFADDPTVRAIIVDDHAGFRTAARRLLEEEGYDVVGEAEDGAAAIAVAREVRPELVLLDVQLPDLDGFELTERLLELDPALQVVLTSSRDEEDYGRYVKGSSARGFVPKAELSGQTLAALLSE